MFQLAPNLTLPASAATETFAFVGTRGSGKTYAAGKMVEEFDAGGVQFVVIDPVGVWYGLRLAANGRSRGLGVPVFGGLHADVPLEPTGGELVARLVVERRISVVLDVSMMTLGQQHRFVTAFATALFNLKKADRSPIHVIIDEAHEFLPQMVGAAEAEMLGAVRRLWKMGRNFGIGDTLISPRPAEINKSVLNLTEHMFCGKLKGAQDRKAVEAWARDQEADLGALAGLANLKNGHLIHWTAQGTEIVRFNKKRTFDASKTPETGDAKPSASLPKIDLAKVREAMAATIEEAKMNDPRELRKRIAELEAAARLQPAPAPPKPGKVREVPVFKETDLKRIEKVAERLATSDGALQEVIVSTGVVRAQAHRDLVEMIGQVQVAVERLAPPQIGPASRSLVLPPIIKGAGFQQRPALIAPKLARRVEARLAVDAGDEKLPKGAREMLAALATSNVDSMTRRQIATLSGIKVTGGTFAKYLGILKGGEYLLVDGEQLRITDKGRAAAGDVSVPRGGEELLAFWEDKLPAGAARMLRYLVLVDRNGVDDVSWAAAVPKNESGDPMERSGGTWAKYKGILVTRGLVEKRGGRFFPSPLFAS